MINYIPIQFLNGKEITPRMVLTETLVAMAKQRQFQCCNRVFGAIDSLVMHEVLEHGKRMG